MFILDNIVAMAIIVMLCGLHELGMDLLLVKAGQQADGGMLSIGDGYAIYKPFSTLHSSGLLARPEVWIQEYSRRTLQVQQLVTFPTTNSTQIDSAEDIARNIYLETLRQVLVGQNLGPYELSVKPKVKLRKYTSTFVDVEKREQGTDWPGFAFTMAGVMRLVNVKFLITSIVSRQIDGDVMETGVWRGGTSIYMHGVLRALGQNNRLSYVCDSFQGLPSSSYTEDKRKFWNDTPYLEVSDVAVKHNFATLGMSSPNIVFVKGFFSKTMPSLRSLHRGNFSLLRLDGDMYESTVDVLYHFYDKLSVGGYVIIDDWTWKKSSFPSKTACEDFFEVHNIQPKIIKIDDTAIYWQKDEDIQIQYWRYEQKNFV